MQITGMYVDKSELEKFGNMLKSRIEVLTLKYMIMRVRNLILILEAAWKYIVRKAVAASR